MPVNNLLLEEEALDAYPPNHDYDSRAFAMSTAISLKRIADSMAQLMEVVNEEARQQRLERRNGR